MGKCRKYSGKYRKKVIQEKCKQLYACKFIV